MATNDAVSIAGTQNSWHGCRPGSLILLIDVFPAEWTDETGLLLDPALRRLVNASHLASPVHQQEWQPVTIERPALVLLEPLDLIGMNDRIIDAIWVHESSQVAQVDPFVDPPDSIVATGTMDFEYADHLSVLPNLDAMLQGSEEDRIGSWQSLDEGKWNVSTIGKNQGFISHLFDNNRVIQAFGVPKGNW